MKKCLLGIAMLLIAGFSFAQDNFVVKPSDAEMVFDLSNPDATVTKEFKVYINASEIECYRTAYFCVTIPDGLELVSYSTRTEKWIELEGSLASGELVSATADVNYYLKGRGENVLAVAIKHTTEEYGFPFENEEPLIRFKCKMTDKVLPGANEFKISDKPFVTGEEGEDVRMMLTKMDKTEVFPPATQTPIDLKVKLAMGSSKYATLCWPAALDFEGTGLTAQVATGTTGGMVQREEVTKVPAGTPVILTADAGDYFLKGAVGDGVAAPASNILKGTADAAYTATSNTFALAQKTEGVGFYRCQAGVEIPKYKAYIEQAGSADESFLFEETTGINNVEAEADNADVYTISGVKVQNPSQKGIYIINGKKVVK